MSKRLAALNIEVPRTKWPKPAVQGSALSPAATEKKPTCHEKSSDKQRGYTFAYSALPLQPVSQASNDRSSQGDIEAQVQVESPSTQSKVSPQAELTYVGDGHQQPFVGDPYK